MPKLSGNVENFTFSINGINDELKVIDFAGTEGVSQCFAFTLTLACRESKLDFSTIIGKLGVLTFYDDKKDVERYVSGIITRIQQADEGHRLTSYSAVLMPRVWLLQHKQDCRIFQNLTVEEIITEVFKAANIPAESYKFTLQGNHQSREYCVQYRETDLRFIERLMQQEGIFYYFEHTADSHLLVISDHLSIHKPISAKSTVVYHSPTGTVSTEDSIYPYHYSEEIRPGKVTLTDYNFVNPAVNLISDNQYEKDDMLEVYDYPGEFKVQNDGKKYAKLQLESWQVARKRGDGSSNCMRMQSGFKFTLGSHPRMDFNNEYLITSVKHSGSQPQVLEEGAGDKGGHYNNSFSCIPADVPYRTHEAIPKAKVEGIQTAIVVGPPGEEIYTDEHGRVRVQFHWDRVGGNDEKSSCWIRVSQIWAGEGWGSMYIPRIGHEVVVDFVEGDPDRPLITGRVYHGTNVPPYTLPAEKTKSTIKSNSSKGGGGYNEFRFEDMKGQEEVYLQGEKDWNILIKNDKGQDVGHDERLEVKNDRKKTVGHDQSEDIGNNKSITVGVDHKENIGKNMTLDVGEDQTISIGTNKKEKIGKDTNIDIGKDLQINVGKNTVINSGDKITLNCGAASIIMKKNGAIEISGKNITLKGSSSIALKAPKISEN
ncbi:MAG: type VI secretion system tip protein VgrG [Gammaproteobacteria bacterium]|nr:type VI secretion system tip protein VgrG [Gammaproteobacteria bacterium]